MTPRLALALGSGSARGLAHIGVLKVFEREGLTISAVTGTSIGALIGGAYAAGMTPAEMEEFALSVDTRRLISLADPGRPTSGLVNGRRVERLIRGFVDHKTFRDTRIPFACVAVDVGRQEEVILRDGDLTAAIRASISTPGVFAPVSLGEHTLVDGAVLNPVPVDLARALGADVVVAVSNVGIPAGSMPVFSNSEGPYLQQVGRIEREGLPEIIYSRALSFVVDTLSSPTVLQNMLGSVELMQRELSNSRLDGADLVIAPLIDGVQYVSFAHAAEIIAAGEEAAEAAVEHVWDALERHRESSLH